MPMPILHFLDGSLTLHTIHMTLVQERRMGNSAHFTYPLVGKLVADKPGSPTVFRRFRSQRNTFWI